MRITVCIVLLSLAVLVLQCEALRIESLWRKSTKSPIVQSGNMHKIDPAGSLGYTLHRDGRCIDRLKMSSLDGSVGTLCNHPTARLTSPILPRHSRVVEGKLANGLSYIILPNAIPAGKFEAHLEVLSGSIHELESQQGMAHLLEHVAYMGSPKRQLISGTGSRTNAYTDFHHTVFFAACPTQTPDQFWKRPMLPMALDALVDVMTCTVDDFRLEKERAAVLSEASMVNKMDYRVECQILSSLHMENRISKRFPIGKESLIRTWSKEDVQRYHSIHYRPDNAVLFIVGDVDIQNTISVIREKFGHLKASVDGHKVLQESQEFPPVSMRDVWRSYPPVTHQWSCGPDKAAALVPAELVKPYFTDMENAATSTTMRLFRHELLQAFSFHLFAKRPIERINSQEALRRDIMRRMAISALQIRLNVQQRQDPIFTFVDFNQMSWSREGCAVCSLDMTTDASSWREAVKLVIKEIKRFGLYGLTQSEFKRYKLASLSEIQHNAAHSQKSSEDVLTELMESTSAGHTYMNPEEKLALSEALLLSITLEEVNAMAKELCEHVSHRNPNDGILPSAIITCAPLVGQSGVPFDVTEDEIMAAIEDGLNEPLTPIIDTIVPETLLTDAQMVERTHKHQPSFVPLNTIKDTQGHSNSLVSGASISSLFGGKVHPSAAAIEGMHKNFEVFQKQLSNGMKVSMKTLNTEPQRVSMRMLVPGGRLLESPNKAGAVLLGARTIQEGGAFLNMTREEVELFCIDHQVMVEITCSEEALVFDFSSINSPIQNSNGIASEQRKGESNISGFEGVMQVAHIILTDFTYEEDAFERAKLSLHEQFTGAVKSLESACIESILYSITGADSRFLLPNHAQIDALDITTCKAAITDQLDPSRVEVALCGDLPIQSMEELVLKYLGSVPARSVSLANSIMSSSGTKPWSTRLKDAARVSVNTLGAERQLSVFLQDSDERAMGYLVGDAPNNWGLFSNGDTIADRFARKSEGKDTGRWTDPLFCCVALQVLEEVANRRLFSVVREERQLTYDASFAFSKREIISGSWYTVSVTASPTQVQAALCACKEALTSLKGSFGVSGEAVQSARRTLISKFNTEQRTGKFWVEHLAGSLSDSIPNKSLRSILEYENVLNLVTASDVQYLVEMFGFDEANMTACVGIAAPVDVNDSPPTIESTRVY